MGEVGIDITGEFPKPWTEEIVRPPTSWSPWVAATPARTIPGTRYVDWELDDPAGMGVEAVRPIRDEIGERVRALLRSLGVTPVLLDG